MNLELALLLAELVQKGAVALKNQVGAIEVCVCIHTYIHVSRAENAFVCVPLYVYVRARAHCHE